MLLAGVSCYLCSFMEHGEGIEDLGIEERRGLMIMVDGDGLWWMVAK